MVTTTQATANIGVVGLAVMGSNLARNLASREGNTVAVYNRSRSKTDELVAEHPEAGFVPTFSYEEFAASLQRPRAAIVMVKAGAGTDAVIDELVKVFEPGDIIVDGGNALFTDTIRREKAVRATGLNFVGMGVSGGEEGALLGPSLMPGGSDESWVTLGPILRSIAAVAGGEPCVTHVGHDGAGHFVKMVHNGIEYGLMAAYAEGLNILKHANIGARA
ncbi:MAG: NAD(P)-binding domain-containing protein, partial [Microbacterium sp.]